MIYLKYQYCVKVNHGTEGDPSYEKTLYDKVVGWNEVNEEIAKKEAYNGEYEIIDDGIEIIEEPTLEEKIDARFAYIEMMTGLLEE